MTTTALQQSQATRQTSIPSRQSKPKGIAIQAKLTVGQPNDKYEQEADRIADQVMQMPDRTSIQRKCTTCEKEEKKIRQKPLINDGFQSIAFPSIQSSSDKCSTYERNARFGCNKNERKITLKSWRTDGKPIRGKGEREVCIKCGNHGCGGTCGIKISTIDFGRLVQEHAECVCGDRNTSLSISGAKTDGIEMIQQKPLAASITPWIQRQTAEEREEGAVQTKSLVSENSTPTASLESSLNSSKSGGSPLPDPTRSFMENRIGADFSNVKIHTDSNAVQMSKELGAQAFTHGNHIYFNSGKYNPESTSGKHLLAHEMVHTLHQRGNSTLMRDIIQKRDDEYKGDSKADSRKGGHVENPKPLKNLNRFFLADLTADEGRPPRKIQAGFRYEGVRIYTNVINKRLTPEDGRVYQILLQDEDQSKIQYPLKAKVDGKIHTFNNHAEFSRFVVTAIKAKLQMTEDFKKARKNPKWALSYAGGTVILTRSADDTYEVVVRPEPPVVVTTPDKMKLKSDHMAFCIDISPSIGTSEYNEILAKIKDSLKNMPAKRLITVQLINFSVDSRSVVRVGQYGPDNPAQVSQNIEANWRYSGSDVFDDTNDERVPEAVELARTGGAKQIIVITDAPPSTYLDITGNVQIIQLEQRYRR